MWLKAGVILATAAFVASDEGSKDLSRNECYLSTRAASYSIAAMITNADLFDTFGEYREMVVMEDITKEEREVVIQATICQELCGKDHKYCKNLKRELEDEAFEKMALFKGILKTKKALVDPPMAIARKLVKDMMDSAGELKDSDVEQIDQQLKKLINEYLSVNKLGDLAQQGLDQFGIPLNIKSALNNNPKAIFTMGKKLFGMAYDKYTNAAQGKEGSGGLGLQELIQEGLKLVQDFASNMGANVNFGDMNHSDQIDDDSSDDSDDLEEPDVDDDWEFDEDIEVGLDDDEFDWDSVEEDDDIVQKYNEHHNAKDEL